MAFIKRLDEQRLRIFATTQIIPVLRGQRDYYEQYMQKTDISALINTSIKAVKREMRTQDSIIFKADDDRIFYVKAYRPMLEQAIVNILKNAVEAIREAKRPNGLINIQMKVDSTNDGDAIRINFLDNGCGIPEERLAEVTKLFMSTRTDKKPNSGIGLFITKRILKVHNGKLTIANNEREGITVSVSLPLWESNANRS
jgi:signal transduction histidine kinase